MRFTFTAPLWEWDARPNWFFVSLPDEQAADIREWPRPPSGFDSVPVSATVGDSTWSTSIFPESAGGSYALPIKLAVREAEDLAPAQPVTVTLEVIDMGRSGGG